MFQNLNDPRRTEWRNSEDELLKAFVMKYGTNSWSRISCTLRYKTPNQCRERWNEYLKHTIREKKWSPQEDENLLRLAKAFPNQWKTIAAALSRSAQQCLTRFDEIVDAETTGQSAGEVPNALVESGVVYPHTQPPNADATTLEQDELIALKEGYSRLANVQNKKERKCLKKAVQEHTYSKIKLRRYRDLQRAGLIAKDHKTAEGEDADAGLQDAPTTQTSLGIETPHTEPPRGQAPVNTAKPHGVSARSAAVSHDTCTFRLKYEECRALGTVFPPESTMY